MSEFAKESLWLVRKGTVILTESFCNFSMIRIFFVATDDFLGRDIFRILLLAIKTQTAFSFSLFTLSLSLSLSLLPLTSSLFLLGYFFSFVFFDLNLKNIFKKLILLLLISFDYFFFL